MCLFTNLWVSVLHDVEMHCIETCRYGPGQSFGKHVDDSVELGDGVYTEHTLLIYLSGSGTPAAKGKQKGAAKGSPGLTGGETVFYGMHQPDLMVLQGPDPHCIWTPSQTRRFIRHLQKWCSHVHMLCGHSSALSKSDHLIDYFTVGFGSIRTC